MSQPATYTAALIARALGRKRQAVARALAAAPADGYVIVCGAPAQAWSYSALPASLRAEIEQDAQRLGFRHGAALLDAPAALQPAPAAIPLAEVAQGSLDKAAKLQHALAGYFARQNDAALSAGELEAFGLKDYAREFGHNISARHLRGLVKRTVDRARAAGLQTYDRLEFYLETNPARKVPLTPIISLAVESEFKALADAIQLFADPAAPSIAEKSYLWLRCFEIYEEKITEGRAPKKLKRALLTWLVRNAPFLAAPDCISPANQIRVSFHRKHAAWLAKDKDAQALADARPEKSGRFRAPKLTEEDGKIFIAESAILGGGMNQAWPVVLPRLSLPVRAYYAHTTECPKRLREIYSNDVTLAKEALHGPHAMRTAGAFVDIEPDGTAPGDWDQSDDMTMVNVWWEEAPDSPAGFWFGQGQLLVWVDERSWFIYGWDLISDPYYDAFSIRNSWTVKADTWGLPRQGLSLERGIWKTSKLLVGEKHPDIEIDSPVQRGANDVPVIHTAAGLRRLGMRFAHATHARGKIIERIYGKIQNYFQAAPGYVGRNPLTDRYEGVQKQIREVKSGKEKPEKYFLHKSQWKKVLDEVCLIHNHTPMHGKYHEGKSPQEVFESKFTTPLVKVPEQYRYLLAKNQYELPVTGNGIKLKFGKQTFIYKCPQFGKLRNQRVIAWFNSEMPETICCTDLDGKNPYIAERGQKVHRHDPLPGTLEKAQEQNAQMNRYQKELHSSLKPYYKTTFYGQMFRPCYVDA